MNSEEMVCVGLPPVPSFIPQVGGQVYWLEAVVLLAVGVGLLFVARWKVDV